MEGGPEGAVQSPLPADEGSGSRVAPESQSGLDPADQALGTFRRPISRRAAAQLGGGAQAIQSHCHQSAN